MPSPLRILFAEPPASRRVGGIETALGGLARTLTAAGVHVTRSSDCDRAAIAAADVVHFHGLWETTHLRARGWCRELGKRFVVSPHGMLEDWAFRHRGWKKQPYFHLLEKPSLKRAAVILATSEAEATTLQQWFDPTQVRVLPLGAEVVPAPDRHDARLRLGVTDDEFVVLFLSRCHEKKGLHLLVAALPEMARDSGRPIHLFIVGDGEAEYLAPLRQATARWSGRLNATWTGPRWGDDKWDYLVAADLFCLPSFSENFGLAVLEALLAGTPVLTTPATPWGALRGTLPVHLVAPAVPALAAALRERLAAAEPTAGERATHRAVAIERFDWSALAPRYRALYHEVLTGSH